MTLPKYAFSSPIDEVETSDDYFWKQIMFCSASDSVIKHFCRDLLNREFNYGGLKRQASLIMNHA